MFCQQSQPWAILVCDLVQCFIKSSSSHLHNDIIDIPYLYVLDLSFLSPQQPSLILTQTPGPNTRPGLKIVTLYMCTAPHHNESGSNVNFSWLVPLIEPFTVLKSGWQTLESVLLVRTLENINLGSRFSSFMLSALYITQLGAGWHQHCVLLWIQDVAATQLWPRTGMEFVRRKSFK